MMRLPMVVVAATTLSAVVQAQSPGAQSPGARPPVPGGVTAFVNVGVVPMDTERVLAGHTVLVESGWITALGPTSKVKVPAGVRRSKEFRWAPGDLGARGVRLCKAPRDRGCHQAGWGLELPDPGE